MSEEKKQIIEKVVSGIESLPETKQMYVLGYMDGVLRAKEMEEPEKREAG